MSWSERVRVALSFSGASTTLLDADWAVIDHTSPVSLLGYPDEFWERHSILDLGKDTGREGRNDTGTSDEGHHLSRFKEAVLAEPGVEHTIELRVRAADDSIEDMALRAINLLDNVPVRAIVLSAWNISNERRVFSELAVRTDTAIALADAQTRLLATVSHELRNPLHVVAGMAELLLLEELSPNAMELARTLSVQLHGLSTITNDLLQIARLDSGMVSVANEPVHISDFVREIEAYGTAATGRKKIICTGKISSDCPTWFATDHARLRQVLRNLVGNAVKFTTKGSVTINVTVDAPINAREDGGRALRFAVSDSGVGIPPAEVANIVEPFRTGSTAGESKGAGLGLAIVSRLVRGLGGTLSIESTIGQGSTFTVSLPLRVVAPPSEAHAAPTTPSELSSTRQPRVLVVEDTPVNQQLAKGQLHRLRMHAYVVDTGEAALEFLSDPTNPPIDVVLMDQQLPGISGLETARRIKLLGDEGIAAIPVIGLTASGSHADRESFLQAGFDGFIPKPASMADLRNGINEALASRSRRVVSPSDESLLIDLESHKDAGGDGLHVSAEHGQTTGRNNHGQTTGRNHSDGVDSWVSVGTSLDSLANEFGDRSTVVDLVTSYVADLQTRGEALLHAIDADDHYTASRIAHSLKSTAKLFGAIELADRCLAVEQKRPFDVDELRDSIKHTVDRLVAWRATS